MVRGLRKIVVFVLTAVLFGSMAVSAALDKTSFMTEVIENELRNNYDGYVGSKFTMTADVTVTALGRADYPGAPMTNEHEVSIWNAEGTEKLASVTVTTSSKKDNGYYYEEISKPLTLSTGKAYCLVSAEPQGGEKWSNLLPLEGKFKGIATDVMGIHGSFTEGGPVNEWYYGDNDQGIPVANFWYAGETSAETDPTTGSSEASSTSPNTSLSASTSTNTNTSTSSSSCLAGAGGNSEGGLNLWIIIGIVAVVVVVGAGATFFLIRKKRSSK